MARFRPIHGIFVVPLFMGAILVADYALEGRLGQAGYERVAPERDGTVAIDLAGLEPRQVRFYRFLNTSNQEVKFFVGRDAEGHLQVAFDANEVCAKGKRGYRSEGDWVVCNKCDKAFRLAEVNAGGGGCKPVPIAFREADDQLVLAESEILKGWRLFR